MTLEEKVNPLRSYYDSFSEEAVKDPRNLEKALGEMPGMLQPDVMDLYANIAVRNAVQKTPGWANTPAYPYYKVTVFDGIRRQAGKQTSL